MWLRRTSLGAAGIAAAVAGKSVQNAHSYVVRRRELQLAAPSSPNASQLRILHISDPHLTAWHHQRGKFLSSLAELAPDLVVVTGDLLATAPALPLLLDSITELLDLPGAFVFGSNDYYSAKPKDPTIYLRRNTSHRGEKTSDLPTEELRQHLVDSGWLDLNNTRARVTAGGWEIELSGVNDPHMAADHYPERARATEKDAACHPGTVDLRIGLSHAPYQHVLDQMHADGCDLVFCGHTHGGQVCLPGQRALVTNCDLPPRYASGIFPWPLNSDLGNQYPLLGDGRAPASEITAEARPMWVQVSAGIGTSPFTPFRVFCPPEAIVLDVVADQLV
ncbi:MAG: metallophosphoesterase [Trueperella sp.]|nr:metallophosphoesterase [Trueperella sp.]